MAEYIGNEFTYLLPGELIVTAEPLKISTILGSCVSVCMYDPEYRIAGMNHYMLPVNKMNDEKYFRYGDSSLKYMLEKMLSLGAKKNRMLARIYGGSSMFHESGLQFNIGIKNHEIAVSFLRQHKIVIKLIDTGGNSGRKVIFDTSAGIISSYLFDSKP